MPFHFVSLYILKQPSDEKNKKNSNNNNNNNSNTSNKSEISFVSQLLCFVYTTLCYRYRHFYSELLRIGYTVKLGYNEQLGTGHFCSL